MAELYVDVEALSHLSKQLTEIKSSLQRTEKGVDAYDPRLGSRRIEGALDDFVKGWTDGRRKIIEGIDGLLGRIETAVAAYQEQEAALAQAARGEP